VLQRFPFLAAIKQILTWDGIDCGTEVQGEGLSSVQQSDLRESLDTLEIFAPV
jgi:hypothetical protein